MSFGLYRMLFWGAVVLGLVAVGWLHGYTRGELKLAEYKAEQAKAAIPIIVKQGKTTEKIVTVYRDRVLVEKGVTETITKEITRYVPQSADPVLGAGWVFLHDAAAAGAIPEPPTGADVAAPAVAASQALQGVVGNYGSCRAVAIRLIMLQAWVREQYQVMNLQPLGY